MSFCLDCFKKHQEGNLPYIMCDPDPEFVVCYGYPENLPQEKIKVGGKILGVANVFGRRDVGRKIVRHLLGGLKRKKIVVESAVGGAWQARAELMQVCFLYSW